MALLFFFSLHLSIYCPSISDQIPPSFALPVLSCTSDGGDTVIATSMLCLASSCADKPAASLTVSVRTTET